MSAIIYRIKYSWSEIKIPWPYTLHLKTMIHTHLKHYISSTLDMSTATSMILWQYWNALAVHPSFFHMNKCTYNCFTTTIDSFQSNIRTSKTQCFNYSKANTIRHTHHDIQSTNQPSQTSSLLTCTRHGHQHR